MASMKVPKTMKPPEQLAEALRRLHNPRWREALMIDDEVPGLALEILCGPEQAANWFMSQAITPYRLMGMTRDPSGKAEVIEMLRKVGPPKEGSK
jgi:hypothetical protein